MLVFVGVSLGMECIFLAVARLGVVVLSLHLLELRLEVACRLSDASVGLLDIGDGFRLSSVDSCWGRTSWEVRVVDPLG